ncbi:MAG: hypothetical protein R8P61_36015 [Bacteroidia bacterium]|nr:hypothetical protein [Bacteroidia bacterium]
MMNSGVLAQEEGKKNIFGIQIGGGISSIEGYEAEKRMGLIGGLYWEYRIGLSRKDFTGSDWGIPLEISLDVSNRLQLGGIINYGLMNVAKNDTPQSSQVKNHWGSSTLSYIFR